MFEALLRWGDRGIVAGMVAVVRGVYFHIRLMELWVVGTTVQVARKSVVIISIKPSTSFRQREFLSAH